MGYLWFDADTILHHTARERAADSETLEQSSDSVTQTQSQQVLRQRQTKRYHLSSLQALKQYLTVGVIFQKNIIQWFEKVKQTWCG